MKTPFTLQRYFIASFAVTIVFAVVSTVVTFLCHRPADPLWLPFAIAPFFGLGCCFSVWCTGEVAWRGSRSTRLRVIPRRNILARLATGIALVLLSPHIPETEWDVNKVLGMIGLLIVIYAIGQLIGFRMKKEIPNKRMDDTAV
jgi:hypothetical protein